MIVIPKLGYEVTVVVFFLKIKFKIDYRRAVRVLNYIMLMYMYIFKYLKVDKLS